MRRRCASATAWAAWPRCRGRTSIAGSARSSARSRAELAGLVSPTERRARGTVQNRAVRGEARAVAGAVPGGVARVPPHDAAEMRAAGRQPMLRPLRIAAFRHLAQTLADDMALAG